MTIDLTEWTEYKSDDPDCGNPPLGIELEFLQVTTISKVMAQQEEEILPWSWRKLPGNETLCTSYWRVKK